MLMTFSEWKQWYRHQPWSLRWFILLILFRPLIDAFYFLKDVSPYLSPLYIVGVATPLLAIYAIFSFSRPNYSRLDTYFSIYTTLLAISCIALFISDSFSLDALDIIFKVTHPAFLYFFLRCFIRSKHDLDGLLQTFLYSSVAVLLIFSYELIFNPINIQLSRGFERFQGTFADTMNYSIYMTGCLLIAGYQIFQKTSSISMNKKILLLIFVAAIAILLLFNIHHTASYIVAGAIAILFLLHNLKSNAAVGISSMLLLSVLLYLAGPDTFNEKVMPLIETDILVYQGEKDDEALLHGRVGRWKGFYDYFTSQSLAVQFLGLPINMESPYMYIGKGSHNDFVRHNMFMGYIGLMVYLFILAVLIIRILKFDTPMHFLGLATLASVILFSATTTPLLYPTLMYFVMPIIAMLALPANLMNSKK